MKNVVNHSALIKSKGKTTSVHHRRDESKFGINTAMTSSGRNTRKYVGSCRTTGELAKKNQES